MESSKRLIIRTKIPDDIQEILPWVREQINAIPFNGIVVSATFMGAPVAVRSELYGPAMGDDPITEEEVVYKPWRGQKYDFRLLKDTSKKVRWTDKVSVVFGPDAKGKSDAKFLFAIYGGPLATQMPTDPRVRDLESSQKFWSQHALAGD